MINRYHIGLSSDINTFASFRIKSRCIPSVWLSIQSPS
nr:MAG TPA: rich Immunoreceptor tyrosine-based activation motif [Caudoviricetes sp.]